VDRAPYVQETRTLNEQSIKNLTNNNNLKKILKTTRKTIHTARVRHPFRRRRSYVLGPRQIAGPHIRLANSESSLFSMGCFLTKSVHQGPQHRAFTPAEDLDPCVRVFTIRSRIFHDCTPIQAGNTNVFLFVGLNFQHVRAQMQMHSRTRVIHTYTYIQLRSCTYKCIHTDICKNINHINTKVFKQL
jgi:hypothetical protein